MESLRIIGTCVAAAVIYGIIHDQFTARICVEYFTIGHPKVFPTTDPTLLGIGWGVIATWWVGLLLGIPLACAAQFGKYPKRTAASLRLLIGKLLLAMGALAFMAGVIAFFAVKNGWIFLLDPLANRVPPEKHVGFLVDVAIHNVSYLVGFLGGLLVIWKVWKSRKLETLLTKAG